MKKYSVMFEVYASQTVEVEAENEKKAKEIANEQVRCEVCHQCSRNGLGIGDIGEVVEVIEIL